MRIYWKIRVKGYGNCIFEHFSDVWHDFKSHDGFAIFYPILMTTNKFKNLKEFSGW